MAGLVDIVPAVEVVEVRGLELEVSGLTVEGIGGLLLRFPELRKMFETRSLDLEALLKCSDKLIAALIAAGTGSAANKAAEKAAAGLALGEKAEVLAAILRVTMPKGVGPFVKLMDAFGMGDLLAVGSQSATASDTTSPSEPSPSSSEAGQKAA